MGNHFTNIKTSKMDQSEIKLAQGLINNLSKGDKKCLTELYGIHWNSISNPTKFGKKFKKAVENGQLNGIKHLGIRSTGRCDEYEIIPFLTERFL